MLHERRFTALLLAGVALNEPPYRLERLLFDVPWGDERLLGG